VFLPVGQSQNRALVTVEKWRRSHRYDTGRQYPDRIATVHARIRHFGSER
jgi:hypothetical protein